MRHPLPPPPLPMPNVDGNQQQMPIVGGFGTAADILQQQQQAFIQNIQQQQNQRAIDPLLLHKLQQALQVHMASQMQQTKAIGQQQSPKTNQIPQPMNNNNQQKQPSTSKSSEPPYKQRQREFAQSLFFKIFYALI